MAAIAEGFILSDDGVKPSCVWIDAGEHYVKQTWRNRCRIASAAGTEDLRVPVVHAGGVKVPVGQVRIDYTTPWVTRTLRAIDAAYCSSAFYLYYCDGMADILASKPETLLELNTALLRFFLDKIGIPADVRLTPHYVHAGRCCRLGRISVNASIPNAPIPFCKIGDLKSRISRSLPKNTAFSRTCP